VWLCVSGAFNTLDGWWGESLAAESKLHVVDYVHLRLNGPTLTPLLLITYQLFRFEAYVGFWWGEGKGLLLQAEGAGALSHETS